MSCSKGICCQFFCLTDHRYRMTEIIKRLHAVYIHAYTFLPQKLSKLRISSSSFMSWHIEGYHPHAPEIFQSLVNWCTILVQFKTSSVHCVSISSSFVCIKNPVCRILRLQRGVSSAICSSTEVESCPAGLFYIIGNSNGIFYYTKKAGCLKTANLLGSFFPILSLLTYNKYRNPRIYIK